jgi:hypothetical protein
MSNLTSGDSAGLNATIRWIPILQSGEWQLLRRLQETGPKSMSGPRTESVTLTCFGTTDLLSLRVRSSTTTATCEASLTWMTPRIGCLVLHHRGLRRPPILSQNRQQAAYNRQRYQAQNLRTGVMFLRGY